MPLSVLEKISSALSRMVITIMSSRNVKPAERRARAWGRELGTRVRFMDRIRGGEWILVRKKTRASEMQIRARTPENRARERAGRRKFFPDPGSRPREAALLRLRRHRRGLRRAGLDHPLDVERQREVLFLDRVELERLGEVDHLDSLRVRDALRGQEHAAEVLVVRVDGLGRARPEVAIHG